MKKLVYLSCIALLVSCSGVKQTQESLNSGNYVNAINRSIAKLSENKTKKGNQEYIYLLEAAFKKNTERELNGIKFLEKDGNGANLEDIYNAYSKLYKTQERIKPLLPLYVREEDRDAKFSFKNYEDKILTSKTKLANYLYDNASNLAKNAINKFDYRKAYEDFVYLNKLSPNFKDTNQKIEDTYQKGIDYVKVKLYNNSNKVLPQNLEADLLNFDAYDLNDLWTKYHTNPLREVVYNYEILLEFNEIEVSPEQVNTKVISKEREIKDGWKYILDESGNVAKDSLGNDLKEDKFKVVKADFYRKTQFKDVQIAGKVSYFDLNTKQQINSYPLASGFIFENVYGNYDGDKRALDEDLIKLTSRRPMPFPSNEQMVFDSGEDLKLNIKNIIKRHRLN